jgi:hypothetical protein
MDFLSIFITAAIGHCGCGAQAKRLPRKATLPEEIALVQNTYRGFLPDPPIQQLVLLFLSEYKKRHRTSHPEQRSSVFFESFDLSTTAVDGRKEFLGIELDEFLGRCDE